MQVSGRIRGGASGSPHRLLRDFDGLPSSGDQPARLEALRAGAGGLPGGSAGLGPIERDSAKMQKLILSPTAQDDMVRFFTPAADRR